jgi:hypothetical protein
MFVCFQGLKSDWQKTQTWRSVGVDCNSGFVFGVAKVPHQTCCCYPQGYCTFILYLAYQPFKAQWSLCTAQWSLYVPHSGHYVPHSGHYMYRTVVTICTASLTFTNSTFCPHSCIYVFCVDLRTNSDYFPIQH